MNRPSDAFKRGKKVKKLAVEAEAGNPGWRKLVENKGSKKKNDTSQPLVADNNNEIGVVYTVKNDEEEDQQEPTQSA